MIFKKNNPGCPCCNCPCSCYKFDDSANDCAGSRNLTATSAEYVTGKLDKAAKFNGSSYYEHADHCCYRLGPDGIAVWFWIKADYNAPNATDGYDYGSGGFVPEGVITKGSMEESGGGYDFDGEWGIFFEFLSASSTIVGALEFIVNNNNASGGAGNIDFIFKGLTQDDWRFFYFWVSIADGKMYVSENGASATSYTLTGTQTLTSDKPLHIGENTDGKKLSEQQPNGERPILIDNVGFCRSIKSKACMEARASKLYNSGTGLACPSGGM